MALADLVFPPLPGWSLFCPAWFLTTAAITSGIGARIHFMPSIGPAFLWFFGLLVLSAMFAGPFPLMLLAVPPFLVSVRVLWRPDPPSWERSVARRLKVNAIVGIVIFVSLTAMMLYIHSTRTTADYVLRWQSAGPARSMVRRLVNSGPESLPDLRTLVREARPWTSADAAEGLASFGEPAVDVPLLINALERARAEAQDGYPIERIEAALRELTGLDQPENTSVEKWRERWATR